MLYQNVEGGDFSKPVTIAVMAYEFGYKGH
jgi:HAMP domain-containing protein